MAPKDVVWGPVVFCGTAPDAAAVAAVLRGPGMLDHVIRLAPPGTDERSGLLRVALESRHASFRMEHLQVLSLAAPSNPNPTCWMIRTSFPV